MLEKPYYEVEPGPTRGRQIARAGAVAAALAAVAAVAAAVSVGRPRIGPVRGG